MKSYLLLRGTTRFSLSFILLVSIGIHSLCQAGALSEDYTVSTAQLSEAPSVSNVDLAQTYYSSSSATGSSEAPSQHAQLFNGVIGNEDGDTSDSGEVTMANGDAVTINFDLTDHPDGFDVRGINTYFGWKTSNGGRANQGYSVQFTFVDGSTATIDPQHWEPNSSASYWTVVSFLPGASGTIASGVESIIFTLSEEANAGGVLIVREIDILSAPTTETGYSIFLEPPNGYRIPKIMGASGDQALLTGFDYFDWFGVTEHRTWFKPSFSSLADDSGITSASAFATASEAIRQDPLRQATANDYYIDWDHFHDEYEDDQMPARMQHLADRDIMPMIVNTTFITDVSIEDDWENIFGYWKYWYTMVYYFASQHDVTLYQMRNEPHAHADYDEWESHWLVSADAMRKAMDDVNADFGKSLTINHAGPVCPGVYWDYSLPHPDVDIHSWGNTSWIKVKYDIYGNYNASNPWNYDSYDYHRYGQDASRGEEIMLDARIDIGNATNDPSSTIPLIISEYNTSTGGNFDRRGNDTEDLYYGVSMAQILHASAVHGPDGLGDDGGIFIFKLGAKHPGTTLVGVGNKLSYTSQKSPNNYGGVTRGGACFQMYARHFSGGKPLLPVTVNSGASDELRTMAVIDEEKGMIYIYGSNCSGSAVPVTVDLSVQDVESGAVAALQRVDEMNTGQVTELLTLNASKKLSFDCPNYTAFLIKVPLAGTVPYQWEITPSEDTTQQVLDTGNQGASSTMNVSMHHSDAAQRNVGLLRFNVDGAGNMGQALLKLSGRNTGTDQVEREIVHVYAVTGEDWSEESTLDWGDAPGLGQYHVNETMMGPTDGTGNMVDIEDNYGGFTSGVGTGLGLTGEFLGAVSFHSSDYVDNYLDVTDYLNSVDHDGSAPLDVTFVVARIVRYDVNVYSNSYYYDVGEYHYDGRVVEIATKEHADAALQPRLICSTGLPPLIEAEGFAHSSGVSLQPSSDVGGGNMVAFSDVGDSASYDVRVSEAGTYLVGFRIASDAGSVNLELAQDGTPITTINRFVGAGESWATIYKMVTLQAGFTTLTVSATDGKIQFLNWLEISASNNYFEDSVSDPVNIALNQTARASNVHSSGYEADKAVDGNLSTRWATRELTPWIEVDFGSTVQVNGARFVEYKDRIRSYEIQAYNGSWEPAFVGGNPSADQLDWFPAVEGSKFRLQIMAATDNPTIWEVELYGAADQASSLALGADSISIEWPNTPGATYAVQSSTNLATDAFSATVESGIPALTETNSITIEMPGKPEAFYRVIAE